MSSSWYAPVLVALLLHCAGMHAVAHARTPARTAPPPTFTPRPTESVPECGADAGHPLLCRGGTEQGKSCGADADCGGGGICERHGHSRQCLEQCQACGDARTRKTPNPLSGLRGDTIGDRVVGSCSTEDNTGDIKGHPQEVTGVTHLAFTPAGNRLFAANARTAVVRGWEDAAATETDAAASIFVGQTNPYNQRWERIAGDLSIGFFNHPMSYTFWQGQLFVGADPTGNLWVTDLHSARRFAAPVFTGQHPDLRLCTDCAPSGVAAGPSGQLAIVDENRVLIWYEPTTNDQPADLAVGAANVHDRPPCNRGGAAGRNTLCGATSVTFDGDGNLLVSDTGNNRALFFKAPLADDIDATNVLGQPDFTTTSPGIGPNKFSSPRQVIAGNSATGWRAAIADSSNHRVLVYENLEFAKRASFVVGQADFASKTAAVSQTGLFEPIGLAVGNGSLWIATGPFLVHNRIVRHRWPVTQNQPAALSVLGQPDFDTGFSTKVVTRGIKGLSEGGIAFASNGGPYISSSAEHRILRWDSAYGATHGREAAAILGQAVGPNEQRRNRGGPVGPNGFFKPRGIATSAGGAHLYVADTNNNRVLEFDDPVRNDDSADRVFGQAGSFATAACNKDGLSAMSLCEPTGVFVDGKGALWVVDARNRRVLRFPDPLNSQTADLVLGQADFSTSGDGGCAQPTAKTLCTPGGVYADVARKRVFVSDNGVGYRARVLVYQGKLSSGMAASKVIGTASLNSWSSCPCPPCLGTDETARRNLCSAGGLALHPKSGALYVANGNGPGVVQYDPPLSTGMPMARSFGCTNPTTWHCAGDVGYIACQWNVSGGLAFDPATRDLWVMDALAETFRVLVVLDPEGPTPSPTITPTRRNTPSTRQGAGARPATPTPTAPPLRR